MSDSDEEKQPATVEEAARVVLEWLSPDDRAQLAAIGGGDMLGDDAVSIGLRLRVARRAHGYTGQDLRTAVKERLGVEISDASIYRIERGEQDLGSEFLVAFCRLTDTHPVWLLTGREPRTWNDAASDQRYTESAARFLQRCLKLLNTRPDLFR